MNIVRKMKSHEIAEAIYHEIQKHDVMPDTPVMSMSQIAEHFNVCLMTAHKALSYLEQQDLIYRIKGKGSFVKKTSQSKNILKIGCAFMEYERNQDSLYEILMNTFPDTAMKYFQAHDCVCHLIPYVFFNDPQYWKGLDGALVSVNLIDQTTMATLRNAEIPIVVFQGESEREIPFDQVIPDHSMALDDLFSHVSNNHFNGIIALCHQHLNGMARAEAFKHAAQKAGFADVTIEILDGVLKDGYRYGLSKAEHCRGKLIFSCSDILTFDIVNALKEKGLEMKRDYEIVTYDNLEAAGVVPFGQPMITAVDYSREDAASVAAEVLLANIRQKKTYRQIIKIPTRLTIRQSAFNEKQPRRRP